MSRKPAIRTRQDALGVVSLLARTSPPGVDVVVGLDRRRRIQLVLPMEPDSPLPEVLDLLAQHCRRGEALLVVSNRTGQDPADRPDDELVWEEMLGTAASYGVVLLDWWVAWGTKAFSVAEFAPSPARWVV